MSGDPTGWGQPFQMNPTILKKKKKKKEAEGEGKMRGRKKGKTQTSAECFPPLELKSRTEGEKSKCNQFSIRAQLERKVAVLLLQIWGARNAVNDFRLG